MRVPKPFEPGAQVHDLGMVRDSRLVLSEVRLLFPSRIHMTPIDCNRFAFGKPGGGGVGFALDLPNELRICRSQRQQAKSNRQQHIPVLTHYSRVMQRILNAKEAFQLEVQMSDVVRQHFGLGSSVSVACAAVYGLNRMFGEPLSIDEMRKVIGHNFVEEYQGKVTRGLETGVGTSVILRGGISVVAGDLVEILCRPFPTGYAVLVIDPQTSRPESDKPESEDMLRRTFSLDGSYRYTKAYNLLMDIIPAIHVGDLRKLGDHIWDIQFSGTHLSMIQSYVEFGRRIYETLGALRNSGAHVCGLSSVGPATYAVCPERETNAIRQAIAEYRGEASVVARVAPNNDGITIIEEH